MAWATQNMGIVSGYHEQEGSHGAVHMVPNDPRPIFSRVTNAKIGDLYIEDKMVGAPLIWDEIIPYIDWTIVGPQAMEIVSRASHLAKRFK
jgi:hypothetical protein